MDEQVNIPAPPWRSKHQDAGRKVGRLIRLASRKGEGIYDPEVPGRTVKKSRRGRTVPVLKLTQVGEMNILRRSRERS